MRAVYTPCEAGPTGFSHHCDAPVPFGLTPSICFAAEPVTQKEIMTDTHILFQPVEFDNLSLKNRIVMAPMTRSFSPGNVPGEDVAAYYRRRAEGEVGLILTKPAARSAFNSGMKARSAIRKIPAIQTFLPGRPRASKPPTSSSGTP